VVPELGVIPVTSDPKPPRRYVWLTVVCLFAALVLAGLGVLIVLGFTGNAKTSDLKDQAQYNVCVREVLAEYEEARDAFIFAGTPETREDARQNLEALYFPDGSAGRKVDRADRTKAICG
jgi:hypothetical protein